MSNIGNNINLDRNSILILFVSVLIGGWLILGGEPPVIAQPSAPAGELAESPGLTNSIANAVSDALPRFQAATPSPLGELAEPTTANLAALNSAVSGQPVQPSQPPAMPVIDAPVAIEHGYSAEGERMVRTPHGWFLCRQIDELGVKIGLPIDAQSKIMDGCANG